MTNEAIDKTKNLKRVDVPIGLLVPDADNPNKMTARQFDLLVDNFSRTGFTDPVLVRPIGDGNYKIVGGHHRVEAAKYLGFTEAPCTIIDDPDFDEEAAMFQNVRMNVIRGQMDPTAFFSMYEKVSGKYETQILQEMFGFADAKEFAKLVSKSAALLPSDLQAKFKEAAKEIGLAPL
jgi:ParB-like chromosome segregation protein Spo0J